MGVLARSWHLCLSLLCIPLLLAGLWLPPAAAAEVALPAVQPLQASLNSDGTLDLLAGHRGSLDARAFGGRGSDGYGWQLIGGSGEAPRFAPVAGSSLDALPDDHWDGHFSSQGTNRGVNALAVDGNGVLYVGGEFTETGGIPANHVARWDGSGWSPLGSGVNNTVTSLAVDGSGNLYAGGVFTMAGGVAANRVARWDGSAWSPMGGGIGSSDPYPDPDVDALVVDGSGDVYAAGQFWEAAGAPGNNIARWDGSAWSTVGGGTNARVGALALDGSGNVYAGGWFTTAGGNAANRVARWDGAQWWAMGSGVDDTVHALAADGNGNVYAGGFFSTAGGNPANRIARWDGSQWSAMDSGMDDWVEALLIDGDGNVYAGGYFTTAGGNPANRIARWDGSAWSSLGAGTTHLVQSLAMDASGDLYAGGLFGTAGGNYVNYIARWDGSTWSALGSGMNNDVWALAADGNGNVYAAGMFFRAGGAPVNCVARWDGSTWSPLGSGINGTVYALAVGGSGNLYAGGYFGTAGGVPANSIARWDGSTWAPLGSGMGGDTPYVYALAVDGSGNLYAGGYFSTAGGVPANGIARWDGTAWSPLGSGIGGGVRSLAVDDSGNLYAGGEFWEAAGAPGNNIARWDGSAWSAMGTGMNDTVYALAVDDSGTLYAGGNFTVAGGAPAKRIARWDGTSWFTLRTGMDDAVVSLAVDGSGNLYAGGAFTMASWIPANYIARWDGSDWFALGSGMDSWVEALAMDGSENVYAGGQFTVAGNRSSLYIARWFNPAPVANPDGYFTLEETALDVPAPGVLENDTDLHGDPLAVALATPPPVGALTLGADGSFHYAPTLNYFGLVTFTYRLADGLGGVSIGTVSITVTNVNDAPVAQDDIYTTTEDTPLAVAAPGVLGNDSDPEGGPLTAAPASPPLHGEVVLSLDGSFVYTPSAGFAGADGWTYLLSDGALTDTALVVIDVGEVDDPPIAQDDAYTTDEDVPLVVGAPGVLENDLDPEGAPLAAVLVAPPAHGALALGADGSFTYTPEVNWNGVVSFTYLASDGELSATAVALLSVTPVNDAPVALGDAYTMTAGTALVIAAPGVLANDADVEGDPLTAVLDTPPAKGSLVLNADGSFVYTAAVGFSGVVTFTYHAYDGTAGSAPVGVMITVQEGEVTTWQVFLPIVFRQAGR